VNAPQQPAAPGAVRLQLLDVLGGFLYTQAIATVARLGVADIVGEEPVLVEELAARVGADPSALHRVMRLLAAVGIFSQAAPGAFVGTQLSDGLRDDRPDSVRYLAMQQGSPAYLAASEMLRCVRTGEPAAETVFGMPFFEYLATDAEASDVFNRAMAGGAAARASVALEYDCPTVRSVCDREKSPHGPDLPISAGRAGELAGSSERTGDRPVQVFSHSELGSNERGTQGSNLESPVLETGNFSDSRWLSRSDFFERCFAQLASEVWGLVQ